MTPSLDDIAEEIHAKHEAERARSERTRKPDGAADDGFVKEAADT